MTARAPALEWTQGHNGVWHAANAMVSVAAWEAEEGGWCWSAGTLDSTMRSHIVDSSTLTCLDAQLAAESAARDLLCEALAAFADPDAVRDVIAEPDDTRDARRVAAS